MIIRVRPGTNDVARLRTIFVSSGRVPGHEEPIRAVCFGACRMTGVVASPSVVAYRTRDLQILATRLVGWLRPRMPGASDLKIVNLSYPLGAGMSHETILFDAMWTEDGAPRQRGLVVRIKPQGELVYQDDMFEEQYRLMMLMHEAGDVKVAQPFLVRGRARLARCTFLRHGKDRGPGSSKLSALFKSRLAGR